VSRGRGEWLHGAHAVESALRNDPANLRRVLLAEGAAERRLQKLRELAERAGVAVELRARRELDRLSGGANHQGALADYRAPAALGEEALFAHLDGLAAAPLLLVLDGVQDPHNLGACLRSADAAGADAVIVPRDRAASLTPAARKVAAGAADSLGLYRVTNLARCLRALRERGIWLVGAAGEADETLFDSDLRGPLALVMGAEGSGLRRLSREACDHLVAIPLCGQVQSLNVSVAAGVCLYEALRQRRQ